MTTKQIKRLAKVEQAPPIAEPTIPTELEDYYALTTPVSPETEAWAQQYATGYDETVNVLREVADYLIVWPGEPQITYPITVAWDEVEEFNERYGTELQLEEGWSMEFAPDPEVPDQFRTALIDPGGWQLTSGGSYISPEGEEFSAEDIADIEETQTSLLSVINQIFPSTVQYPEQVEGALEVINTNPDWFVEQLQKLGRTPETEAALRMMVEELDEGGKEKFLAQVFGERYEWTWPSWMRAIPGWGDQWPSWLQTAVGGEAGKGGLLKAIEVVSAPWETLMFGMRAQLHQWSHPDATTPKEREFLTALTGAAGLFREEVQELGRDYAAESIPGWQRTWVGIFNPVWFAPIKVPGGLVRLPSFGKYIGFKRIGGTEHFLMTPVSKPTSWVSGGLSNLLKRTARKGEPPPPVRMPDVVSPEEFLAYVAEHHPGRLGQSRLGPQVYPKLTIAEEYEQIIKGARLVQANAQEVGVSTADFAVSQLDLIADIYKALGYNEVRGVFTTGVKATEGAPKVGGLPSYAVRDVLEYSHLYKFADPSVGRWIKAADSLIDDAVRLAESHGIEITKKLYFDLAHYFPSKVTGLAGVKEAAQVGPGAARLGAKAGFTRHRVFEFMEEGLSQGYIYAGPKDALRFYFQGIYRMIGNKQALDILKPLLKPLPKETETGAALIAGAEAARLGARRAESLVRLLQRVKRGETPHPSTMRWLDRTAPEMAPRVRAQIGEVSPPAMRKLITEAKLIESRAKLTAAEAVSKRASFVEIASQRGFTEGMVNLPALRNRIFPDITVNGKRITGEEVAKLVEKVFAEEVPKWLAIPRDLSRGFVVLQAALDTSGPFIQGGYTLGYDVFRWLTGHPSFIWPRTAAEHVAIMLKPDILKGFRHKHLLTYERYMPEGLITASDLTEFYVGLGFMGRTVGKLPVVGKPFKWGLEQTYGRAGTGFGGWGEEARILLIESMERAWLKGGGTRRELVELVNQMTGVVSTKVWGVGAKQIAAESALLFAPRYTRANLLVMGNLFTRGMTGHMIRRSVGGMAMGMLLAYSALCTALGQPIKINPAPRRYQNEGIFEGLPDFLQPWGAEAFTVRVGEHNVGLPGFPYSFAKMWAGLIATAIEEPDKIYRIDIEEIRRTHPALQWLWGKSSPLVGLTREMVMGRDFLGNRFEDAGDYLENIGENFLTIALQSVLAQDPPATLPVFMMEVMGWRTYPQSAWGKFYDRADEIIADMEGIELDERQLQKRADGTLGWYDLDKLQRSRLLEQFPDLAELQLIAEAASARRSSGEWLEWETEDDRIDTERDESQVTLLGKLRDPGQDFNIVDFRKGLSTIGSETHTKREELEKRFPAVYAEFDKNRAEGEEDSTDFERAYNEWYDWVLYGPGTEDELGDPIWSVIEGRKAEWMQKWGQSYLDGIIELQEAGYAGKDPLLWKKREDSYGLEDYWAIVDDKGEIDRAARLEYRQDSDNLENEARLIFWGYTTTIQNEEAEEIVRDWCEEYNVNIGDIPAFAKLTISEADMERYGITDSDILRKYWGLDAGTARYQFRWDNPGLDALLVEMQGYKPIRDWWSP